MADAKFTLTFTHYLSHNNDFEYILLRSAIAASQANVMAEKKDNNALQNELFEEITILRNELKTFKSHMVSDLNKIKNSVAECQLSNERMYNEKSNGVANVKSDIRQIFGIDRCEMF